MPYRDYRREQDWLLPPSVGELVPADHPVRFVAEFVDVLDLRTVGIGAEPAAEGAPRYRPEALLAAWLYGFMVHVRSSRKLERACHENIPFLWLTGLQRPDHVTLWRFYTEHRAAMRKLLRETVRLATEVGLVDFALQAVDGSRIAVSGPDRLRNRSAVERLLAQVEAESAAMEQSNQQAEGPDGQAPKGAGGAWAQHNLRDRLRQALAVLDDQAPAGAAMEPPTQPRRPGRSGGRGVEESAAARNQPTQKGRRRAEPQVNPTDPEAVLMKGRSGYCVGYNGQVIIDSQAQIVVGAAVVASSGDVNQLLPLLDEAEAMAGQRAAAVVADSGYFNIADIVAAEQRGIATFIPDHRGGQNAPEQDPYHKAHFVYDTTSDTYRCPHGQLLTYRGEHRWKSREVRVYMASDCQGCVAQQEGRCTRSRARSLAIHGYEAALQDHAAHMNTAAARRILRRRQAVVEPVFAVFREQLGLRRFLARGRDKVSAEWRLLCVAHNLRKLWKLWWQPRVRQSLAAA